MGMLHKCGQWRLMHTLRISPASLLMRLHLGSAQLLQTWCQTRNMCRGRDQTPLCSGPRQLSHRSRQAPRSSPRGRCQQGRQLSVARWPPCSGPLAWGAHLWSRLLPFSRETGARCPLRVRRRAHMAACPSPQLRAQLPAPTPASSGPCASRAGWEWRSPRRLQSLPRRSCAPCASWHQRSQQTMRSILCPQRWSMLRFPGPVKPLAPPFSSLALVRQQPGQVSQSHCRANPRFPQRKVRNVCTCSVPRIPPPLTLLLSWCVRGKEGTCLYRAVYQACA